MMRRPGRGCAPSVRRASVRITAEPATRRSLFNASIRTSARPTSCRPSPASTFYPKERWRIADAAGVHNIPSTLQEDLSELRCLRSPARPASDDDRRGNELEAFEAALAFGRQRVDDA